MGYIRFVVRVKVLRKDLCKGSRQKYPVTDAAPEDEHHPSQGTGISSTLRDSRNSFEPRHDKTCLREFPTRPDTNRPAQLRKLALGLKFWLQKLETLHYLGSE